MSRGSYNRTALFTVTTPPDFRPQRAWDVPNAFAAATLYMKNLSVHEARRFTRLFNAKQVQLCERGEWDHSWMIVSSCCRQGHPFFESNLDAQQPVAVEGGVT